MNISIYKVGRLFLYPVILFFILIMVFPFYWVLVTSLKDPGEIFRLPPTLIPRMFSCENYVDVMNTSNIPRYFINSAGLTIVTLFLILTVSSLAAYSVSRFRFKGKNLYFIVILISQMMPGITLLISLYMFWSSLGVRDTYISIIVMYVGFQGIPASIDQAATIDGCSTLRIIFRIILPLSKPALVATGLGIILSTWQELMIAVTFIKDDAWKTLPSGIASQITRQGIKWGPLTAASVITLIPVFILFVFLQRYIISGLTAGSVKG